MTTTVKRGLAVSMFVVTSFLFLSFSSAEIKKTDLKKPVMISEEAALLSQIDVVSLYLSSDRVAFAPKLSKDGVIEVETTVLSPELSADQPKMNDFVERNCTTFVSVLKDRLPTYAPAVSEKFDSAKDIVFNVNSGTSRSSVGVWKGGVWQPTGQQVAKATEPQKSEVQEEKTENPGKPGRKGCNCPARK